MPSTSGTLRTEIEQRGKTAVTLARQALADELLLPNRPDLLFLSLSGAHIYGFPSADSDLDLRGAHLLPLSQVVGLSPVSETYQPPAAEIQGTELDCVTHDLGKYLRLLTRKNGYILEQIMSPLVVVDSPHLPELRSLAAGALTRHLVHHYRGFFRNQQQLVQRSHQAKVKGLLYLFRVAMSGLYLLRTHRVETDLLRLNEAMFGLPFLAELVQRKISGSEQGVLQERERDQLLAEAIRLADQLEEAAATSGLPDTPANLEAINDFLVRLRLAKR